LKFHSEGTEYANSTYMPVSGDYNINTENTLIGLQIGADLTFRRCKWNWGFHAKAGPYLNFAQNEKEISTHADAWNAYLESSTINTNAKSFNTGILTARSQRAAFIGEVGIAAEYKFKPNFTGRVSYDFSWATGLALAPEQLDWDYDQKSEINTNGTLFTHGLTMGLEWLW
jgi:hypothetical protein